MENLIEKFGEAAAAIIAGLYICDQAKAVCLLENIDIVMYVKGVGHYKRIVYDGLKADMIKINCHDLELLLSVSKLTKEHESYWVNFDFVLWTERVGWDLKARMKDGEPASINRDNAAAFIKKCKKAGKKKPKS